MLQIKLQLIENSSKGNALTISFPSKKLRNSLLLKRFLIIFCFQGMYDTSLRKVCKWFCVLGDMKWFSLGLLSICKSNSNSFHHEAKEPRLELGRMHHIYISSTKRIVSKRPEGTISLNGLLFSHLAQNPCQRAYSTMQQNQITMGAFIQFKWGDCIFELSTDSLFWHLSF